MIRIVFRRNGSGAFLHDANMPVVPRPGDKIYFPSGNMFKVDFVEYEIKTEDKNNEVVVYCTD